MTRLAKAIAEADNANLKMKKWGVRFADRRNSFPALAESIIFIFDF